MHTLLHEGQDILEHHFRRESHRDGSHDNAKQQH
jgi:hypothetical protein